ncbi:hypothetical protein GXW82_10410 [Streptacidiphilus sp. 4-A2]|nr:hypothetical protein [Streptacidiphilus sp. 4-A2]
MIPVSFAQQRLWLVDQIEGPSPLYNLPVALRLHGSLDLPALRTALADVMGRHEALRTVFPELAGVPVQQVLPVAEAPLRFEVVDCGPEEYPALRRGAAGPFDLRRDPPMRATVFRLGPDEAVLLVVLHHIAGDGWSLHRCCGTWGAPTRRARGRSPDWEPLPVQYADYALWQRRLLGAEEDPQSLQHRQLAYWRQQLAGLPEELELPVDRPGTRRPATARRPVTSAWTRNCMPGCAASPSSSGSPCSPCSRPGSRPCCPGSGGHRHPAGHGGGRPDRRGAERPGRVLRQHPGAARRHLRRPLVHGMVGRVRKTHLEALSHQDIPFDRLVRRSIRRVRWHGTHCSR